MHKRNLHVQTGILLVSAVEAIVDKVEGRFRRSASKRDAAVAEIKGIDFARYGPSWGHNVDYFASHTVCSNCHLMFNVVHDETSDHCDPDTSTVKGQTTVNGHVYDKQLHEALIEFVAERNKMKTSDFPELALPK